MKSPVTFVWRAALLAGTIVLTLSIPARADASPDNLKVGFFLLHDVCDEESSVNLITIVKTTPADVADYVQRISKLAGQGLKSVEAMEERDPALKMERNPLPDFEQKVRSGIRADKEHQLLFGTTGTAFARALLVTQIEASNYISQITQQLADEDPSGSDTRTLLRMSSRWLAIRDEGFRLLAR